jgi:hypothetical protein
MTKYRGWFVVSGVLLLVSVLLAGRHSPYWMFLTALVGLGLRQSGFADWGFVACLLRPHLAWTWKGNRC